MKFEIFVLRDEVLNFGLPLILSGVVVLLIFRPRIKILNLKTRNGSMRDFYCIVLWLLHMIPFIIFQNYLETFTGKLTELESIHEFQKYTPTKYYTLKKHFIDDARVGVHSEFHTSGKGNNNFNMSLFYVLPLYETRSDTLNPPTAWIGIENKKRVSNHLKDSEKRMEIQKFREESQSNFKSIDFSRFVYLDRIRPSETKTGYLEAVHNISIKPSSELIFEMVNDPFEERNGNKLIILRNVVLIGSFVWFVMVLIPKIDKKEVNRFEKGTANKDIQKGLSEVLPLLIPREGFFVTLLIVYANVAVYITMVFLGLGFVSFKAKTLLEYGASFGPYVKEGQWWRLITSTFLHSSIGHLFYNLIALIVVGLFLEPIIKKWRLFIAYIILGILASLSSIWWNGYNISVGASGAIFGLYGILLGFYLTKILSTKQSNFPLILTSIILVPSLLIGFIIKCVDNAAHLGGLLSGFILSLILSIQIEKQDEIG
jgi:rhomboid protease GluP